MRVLAITNEFPLPPDRGGPVRFLGLARALAERHEVHMLALARPSTTAELERELSRQLGGPVEAFQPRPPGRSGPLPAALHWGRALADGIPPFIRAQHSLELERRARELAPGVDAVAVLDDFAGIYAPALAPAAAVVCDKSNVMGASSTEAAVPGALSGRLRRRLTIDLVRRFERSCLAAAAGVVVTSAEESRRLEDLYGRAADAVVPSAFDLPAPVELSGEPVVGWLGSHEYDVNVEGLLRFVEEAWEPLGRDGMRLLIAGGSPPERVRALERLPGVEVLGYVERLDDFLGRLSAAVVPLWRGAGVKLKTLAFMGAGVPVAGTPVALEGIAAQDGRECLLAEDPVGLGDALRGLLSDPHRARLMGNEARALIAADYTWDSVGPRFREAVERAAIARS